MSFIGEDELEVATASEWVPLPKSLGPGRGYWKALERLWGLPGESKSDRRVASLLRSFSPWEKSLALALRESGEGDGWQKSLADVGRRVADTGLPIVWLAWPSERTHVFGIALPHTGLFFPCFVHEETAIQLMRRETAGDLL